jgi:hypothetical protein
MKSWRGKGPRACPKCGQEVGRYSTFDDCEDCRIDADCPTPEEIEAEKAKIREENIAERRAMTWIEDWQFSVREPRTFRLRME